jgi:DegV family protein with EDD domain
MVRIISDTTACLPDSIRDQYSIPIVPQLIHFGERSYTEGIDIDINQFLEMLPAAKDLPKTSAPPPELFSRIFSQINQDEPVLCIHPSSDLSGTVRSAETARLDFPEMDIRVIDTRLVASPLGVLVHQAAIWASQGLSIDRIYEGVSNLSKRCRMFFLVATLDYLARGGRIGGASALIGNALQIKPILTIIDGRVEQHSKERTFSKALEHLKLLVLENYPPDADGYLTIMHADNAELASDLSQIFAEKLSINPPLISSLPPAIITHAGPGSIAVGFFGSS